MKKTACCDYFEEKNNQRKIDPVTTRFVRYKDGAKLFGMSQTKFEELAKDSKSVYKWGKIVLVNLDRVERYLEEFRIH